jgi:hypothetical protein
LSDEVSVCKTAHANFGTITGIQGFDPMLKTPKGVLASALLILALLFACKTTTPAQPATVRALTQLDPVAVMEQTADIKLKDNGRTFSYKITDRFSVFLDDTKYPVKNLTCTPDGLIAYGSNGSFRGATRSCSRALPPVNAF